MSGHRIEIKFRAFEVAVLFSLVQIHSFFARTEGGGSSVVFPLTATHCPVSHGHWPWKFGFNVDLTWNSARWEDERNSAAAKGGPEKQKRFHQANETCQQQQGCRAWSPRMQQEWKRSQRRRRGWEETKNSSLCPITAGVGGVGQEADMKQDTIKVWHNNWQVLTLFSGHQVLLRQVAEAGLTKLQGPSVHHPFQGLGRGPENVFIWS